MLKLCQVEECVCINVCACALFFRQAVTKTQLSTQMVNGGDSNKLEGTVNCRGEDGDGK